MIVNSAKSKPTLVLLHGWGVNHAVWQQVIMSLEPDFQVLALDLPGYGLSPQLPAEYSLPALAELLAHQLPEQCHLLGWSLGGLVATQIALQYPQKVKKLALLASSPCFMQHSGWPGMSHQVLEQFAGALSENLALTVERFLAIQAMGSTTARQDIRQLKQAVLSLPLPEAQVLSAGLALLQHCDLTTQLADLSMPVDYVLGRLDSLVPVKIAQLLPAYCPHANFHIFAKASHAPFISHPAEFQQWLLQWLNT